MKSSEPFLEDGMVKACGWCQPGTTVYDSHPEWKGLPISHGICPACFAKIAPNKDNLIGKRVYITFPTLREGTVIEHHKDPEYFIVETDDGGRETTSKASLHETREDALRTCEANVQYWEYQCDKLR